MGEQASRTREERARKGARGLLEAADRQDAASLHRKASSPQTAASDALR